MPSDSDAKDICDLEGQKIVTHSAVSITIMWGVYAREFCDLDLRAGGGDYELVVTDPQNAAGLIERGDADAGLLLPDFSIPQLSSGVIKPLYDAKSVSQIYAEEFSSDPEEPTHPQNNVFVARKAWVEKNPDEASFLIEIWDRGVKEWAANRDEIIEAYPEDFAAESPEEKKFIQDWLNDQYDWFVADHLPRRGLGRERDRAVRPDEGDRVRRRGHRGARLHHHREAVLTDLPGSPAVVPAPGEPADHALMKETP